MGGPRRTPGESVDALSEAIDVIRALWDADGRNGPRRRRALPGHRRAPGPGTAHDVEIWLGAYKPRMLALTGAKADGWLPSHRATCELRIRCPTMNRRIDDAAARGRPLTPPTIRRLLNVNGSFGDGGGFLEGPPARWPSSFAGAHARGPA